MTWDRIIIISLLLWVWIGSFLYERFIRKEEEDLQHPVPFIERCKWFWGTFFLFSLFGHSLYSVILGFISKLFFHMDSKLYNLFVLYIPLAYCFLCFCILLLYRTNKKESK